MKQRMMIVLVILVIFLYNNVVTVQGQGWISAQCNLFDPTMMNRVHGRINLYQRYGTPRVQVTGKIYGLTQGLHGFHVHNQGNFGNNCSNAGPHFNPFNQHHGSPTDNKRHVGDLGNVYANKWGIADVFIYDHIIRLQASKDLSILDRSIVVDCSNAGPHFNPFNQHHGSPTDNKRHVGDLGNVYANKWGIAHVFIYDHIIRLQASKDLSILDRSIVVHAQPDDLGRGGNEESLRTGNAGARLACCQIRSMFY